MVIVRGGGDLASGTIYRLHRCGYQVLVLETERPTAIRRQVSFCEAVYDGAAAVEQAVCQKAASWEECQKAWSQGEIPLMVDPQGEMIGKLRPEAVVDAILAKRNLGTHRGMAPLTVALGPGFCAGADVDYVIETKRGHQLGRVLEKGYAIANTGVPGLIEGYGAERVIHAPAAGKIQALAEIGQIVEKGQLIARIGGEPVAAALSGVLRGIIRDGFEVFKGMKIADIDPRKGQKENCGTISDKARCIAGSVLEVLVREGVYPK